jgi:membrane-associated phospholipid phosphatase
VNPVLRSSLAWMLIANLFAPIDSFDHWIQAQVQAGRHPALEPLMRGASGIGRPTIVLGSLFVAALVTGGPGLATARTVLLALAPTNLVVEGLKRATQRARPDGRTQRKNASFPSSHAANAFALAVSLTVFRPRWRIPCLLLAALVAWSRVYLNRHFISDIVVGAAIGVGFGLWAAYWSAGVGRRWIGSGLAPRAAEEPPRA